MAETKMPDAAEWAERFQRYGAHTRECAAAVARLSKYVGEEHPERYASYEELLLAYRREVLRAAAQGIDHRASSIPMSTGCAKFCPRCHLERLAEEP